MDDHHRSYQPYSLLLNSKFLMCLIMISYHLICNILNHMDQPVILNE